MHGGIPERRKDGHLGILILRDSNEKERRDNSILIIRGAHIVE